MTSPRKTHSPPLSPAALGSALHAASLGIRCIDLHGRLLWANPAALHMLGYSSAEYLGRPIADFHVVPAEADELLARLARGEHIANFETLLRSKDGSVKHILTDAQAISVDGKPGQAIFFDRDITERKKAVQEILELREREQQRLGQDLHDGVCQQLIGIKFKLAILERKLSEKAVPEADDAAAISKLLDQTVEDTYRLSRGLQPVKLTAEALMYALQELAAGTASLYGIRCVFQLRKPVFFHDPGAAIHLYRIAQESVSNAVKHGKATRVFISLLLQPAQIILTIKDNGLGLHHHHGRKGMGLQIMNYRARTINRNLVIRSRRHAGTRVTCSIPTPHGTLAHEDPAWT